MTLSKIIDTMKTILDFKYATVDRLSVKLWKDKPKFDTRSKCWLGDGCICMLDLVRELDLSDYKTNSGQVLFSRILTSV